MATAAGSLEIIARQLGLALASLGELDTQTTQVVCAELGIDIPADVLSSPQFASAITGTANAAGQLSTAVSHLTAAIDAQDASQILSTGAEVLSAIATVIGSLAAIDAQLPGTGFSTHLLPYLIIRYLEFAWPILSNTFTLLGIIDRIHDPGITGDPTHPPRVIRILHLDRMSTLLHDPLAVAREVYQWSEPGFDGQLVLQRVLDTFADVPYPATLTTVGGAPALTTPYFDLAADATGLTATIHVPLTAGVDLTLPLPNPDWTVQFNVGVTLTAGCEITLSPPDTLTAQAPGATLAGEITAALAGQSSSPGDAIVLFGETGGSRLQAEQASATLGVAFAVSTGGASTVSPAVQLAAHGGKLIIDTSSGDGFIAVLLSGVQLEADFDLDASWQAATGLRFRGSAGMVFEPALAIALGPVTIDQLHMSIELDTDGSLVLELSLILSAAIGPIEASVDRIGATGQLAFPQGGGNLGPANLSAAFKPPNGLGLSIDAAVVTGGGYIQCDVDKGQYAGVLELALESVSLTAIGLIQTKMADGTPLPGGFSLLVIISVEFLPPIELGFGFTLNGVGGYLGLNRTMNADALRAGVHSGSLNDIMFPADPVGHPPQIIQELAGFFPAAPGRFLIGPMVQIQWGSPLPILTADLGVIIELPAPVRIAILGVLQVGLPQADEDAIILLNLDVLGLVDFGLGTLSLDASLYGSRIAEFPVTGDMALRLGWKAERDFIASWGGCHPAQQLPPNFPTLDRLAIALSSSDKLTLTLQAYLAATSNTLQFGASAHLLAQIGDARVDGMVSFDALIHTNPFGVQVDFAAAVTVWIDGQQLLAVSITGQLTGPAPWQVSAQASISLFGISTTIPVQFSLGAAAALLIPAPIFVAGLLAGDVGKSANWSALPPPGDTVVTLTPAPPSGTDMRAHPLGSLTFHQHTAPLGIAIDKFGSADVSGPSKLALTSISYGNSPVDPAAVTPVQDAFAPGQFLALSDSDALSLPAFATYQAGVTFTPAAPDLDDLATGDATALSYTINLIDSHGQLPASPPPPLDAQAASRVVASGPAARAPARTTGPRRYQGTPGTIAVKPRPPAGRQAP